jgi:hypothetical protein
MSRTQVTQRLTKTILRRIRHLLSGTLTTIIGDYHHDFVTGKGIPEPSLIATHLIQDTQQTDYPLQLIILNIERHVIKFVMLSSFKHFEPFGVPEILSQALQN